MLHRSMMQVYVKGSVQATMLYQKAFGATLETVYQHPDGSYAHAELDAEGQILAISETDTEMDSGNTMQFCLHYEAQDTEKVRHAYEVLREGAVVVSPLGKCPFSECMFALIDSFGVSWCLFT